jgi:hypothetical protein
MARARNYPMCKNAENQNAMRMIFLSSISKLNVLATGTSKAVLDE